MNKKKHIPFVASALLLASSAMASMRNTARSIFYKDSNDSLDEQDRRIQAAADKRARKNAKRIKDGNL